jgi:hypothetical protein
LRQFQTKQILLNPFSRHIHLHNLFPALASADGTVICGAWVSGGDTGLNTLGRDSLISKWRRHLLKGFIQTAVNAHLLTFGE